MTGQYRVLEHPSGGTTRSIDSSRPQPLLRLSVLDSFTLENDGLKITLAEGSRRLLAFLALQGKLLDRRLVAGTLWPNSTESKAHSCLRSALSRLPVEGRMAVDAGLTEVGLAEGVVVDIRESRALAYRVLNRALPDHDDGSDRPAVIALSGELLPGWYDDWLLLEVEEWRQLRLHALEALAGSLTAEGRFGEAAAAALAAVRAEPLRESGHAALITVHQAEGNQSEALREFELYREMLFSELGLEPTTGLRDLVTSPQSRDGDGVRG